jgi:hypothetical protein
LIISKDSKVAPGHLVGRAMGALSEISAKRVNLCNLKNTEGYSYSSKRASLAAVARSTKLVLLSVMVLQLRRKVVAISEGDISL